jgi:hypothetical protein
MKSRYTTLLSILVWLPAVPVLGQTTIGGGACTSSALNGTYQLLLSGRQLTATGMTTKQFQAVGTATFDGLSKVTFTMTANTVTTSQSFGTPLAYSGSYSLQSNCLGSISMTSGDTATFTLEAYAQGGTFAVTGSDANYAYNGTGNMLPAACPTTLSGVHEFNATGSTLSGASVTGVLDVAGVLQFDGQGNLTAQWTLVSNLTSTAISATGTYSLNSSCLASATLTDSANNKYAVSLTIYSTAPDFALAVTSPQLFFDGYGSAAAATTGAAAACTASLLSGSYEFHLSGRLAPGGIATRALSAVGAATFDGQSKVTLNLTTYAVNGSQTFGTQAAFSGTYSLSSNCQGSINITSGDAATLALVAYSVDAATGRARAFSLVGTDATYAYSGAGNLQPSGCALSTLSGTFPFSGVGNALSGASLTDVVDVAGVMQFDGQGNATANWTQSSNTARSTPRCPRTSSPASPL